jgi:hypothetical protein
MLSHNGNTIAAFSTRRPTMSDVPSAAPPAPAAVPARTFQRHAWGLPAGSVRAILALAVLGLLWAAALFHPRGETVGEAEKHLPTVLLSLQVLMVLMLVHYFTAHGKTIGRHISGAAPLHAPGGTIRFVLAGGYIGLCVLLLYNHADFDAGPDKDVLWSLLLELVVVLVAYFVGHAITGVVHTFWGNPPPAPYQDLEAWVAMLAMIGLVVVVLMHLGNLKLAVENRVPMDYAQAVVSGLIGLYFGARS